MKVYISNVKFDNILGGDGKFTEKTRVRVDFIMISPSINLKGTYNLSKEEYYELGDKIGERIKELINSK